MNQLFASGGQSIGVSASASILPMTIQGWFPLGLTGWISLQSKELSSLLQHHSSKASVLWCSAFYVVQLSHPYMTTGKTIILTIWTFVSKMMSLLLNTLSRFVIAFLLRNKCLVAAAKSFRDHLIHLLIRSILLIGKLSLSRAKCLVPSYVALSSNLELESRV